MATALQTVIAALHARVSDAIDPALKQQLADALDQHAAEQAEVQQLRDDYAALKARLDAFTGGGDVKATLDRLTERVDAISVPDLGPLNDAVTATEGRLDALEDRNAQDDAAAANQVTGDAAKEPAPAPAADSAKVAPPAGKTTTKSKKKAKT